MLSSSGDVYWLMNICHALFIFLHFSSYLTHAHHSIYIFMLTTSPCWWISWMYLLINSSLLQQLANNVQRYCFSLEQICCLLDTFFTIKKTGPPLFFNFGCIFHQYCQNILEIYASYEILHQNDFAQFFAILRSSRTSTGTTCSANAPLRKSVA